MKRLISVVLVILLGFNIYLGYEVYQLKQNRPSKHLKQEFQNCF